VVIDIAAAIVTQAAPSAINLDCFKGGPPLRGEGSGGRLECPDETAAHEHIHGALFIYPNKFWECVSPLFPQKARGAMVVDGCPGEALHIEHLEENERTNYQRIMIPSRKICQCGRHEFVINVDGLNLCSLKWHAAHRSWRAAPQAARAIHEIGSPWLV
jgi:hypothetical protein